MRLLRYVRLRRLWVRRAQRYSQHQPVGVVRLRLLRGLLPIPGPVWRQLREEEARLRARHGLRVAH